MVPFQGMFRLCNEQHVATLNMTFYKRAVKLLFSLLIISCKHSHSIRPPKLVRLKLASKLQTVSQLYQGWRGVATKRHLNEGAAG